MSFFNVIMLKLYRNPRKLTNKMAAESIIMDCGHANYCYLCIRIAISYHNCTDMFNQTEFTLAPRPRGCHLVTDEILRSLPSPLPQTGLLNLFVKHTSCALSINENADPDVRVDLNRILDRVVPENQPFYIHTFEGADDMPAHAKSTLAGVSINIPITRGRLNLGTWQGIYLLEFRNYGGARKVVATVIG